MFFHSFLNKPLIFPFIFVSSCLISEPVWLYKRKWLPAKAHRHAVSGTRRFTSAADDAAKRHTTFKTSAVLIADFPVQRPVLTAGH